MMTKEFKLLPPTMPNFLCLDMPGNPTPTIAITDLTEEEAKEYGDMMAREFVNHWYEKMKLVKKEGTR